MSSPLSSPPSWSPDIPALMDNAPCDGCDGCPLANGWIETRPRQRRYGQQAGGYVPPHTEGSHPKYLVIGEAPGLEEVEQGKGFVGASGKMLRSSMEAVDIDPTTVQWANVVRCRPPQNRDPKPDEIERCGGLLADTLATSKALVVVAVGRVALDRVLGPAFTRKLVKSRSSWDGYVFEWGDEIEGQVVVGKGRRYVGEVYKTSNKKRGITKGDPKLSSVELTVDVPRGTNMRGVVATLHPSFIQRKGLTNQEQLTAALSVAKKLADGLPIYRGPDMAHVITNPSEW